MATEFDRMKADKTLEKDINSANNSAEIRELLLRSVERSGIADRDPVTGQYVPRDRSQAAPPAEEPHTFTRTVEIGGKMFDFTASSEEMLEYQIQSARAVAEELQNTAAPRVEEREEPTEAERQQKLWEQSQLQLKFQRGEIGVKEYLEQSGAIGDYLESQGISVEGLREQAQTREGKQFEKSWQEATGAFLNGPGTDWPGGEKNQAVIQNMLIAMNLQDAEDKVGALVQAYNEMKKQGVIFEREATEGEVLKAFDPRTGDAWKDTTPQELIEIFKRGQEGFNIGDSSKANETFVNLFRRK